MSRLEVTSIVNSEYMLGEAHLQRPPSAPCLLAVPRTVQSILEITDLNKTLNKFPVPSHAVTFQTVCNMNWFQYDILYFLRQNQKCNRLQAYYK
jgi:hypothetical protein